MVELEIIIEKIGGISGQRVICRFVRDYYKDYMGGITIRLSDEKHTLLIEKELLEKVIELLIYNEKGKSYGESALFSRNVRVAEDYLVTIVDFSDGKIKKLKFKSAKGCLDDQR